jgi:hypothetical protein
MSHLLIDCYSTVFRNGRRDAGAVPPHSFKALCVAFCLGACLLAFNRSIPFVPFVVLVNATLIFFVPILTAAIWYLTSRPGMIGAAYVNRWWEHVVLAALLGGSVYAVAIRGPEISRQLYDLMFG